MVIMKNSEYRKNYEPKFEKHAQAYSENLGYRTTRRSAEFAHNRDVFTWEPESWEKSSCTSVLEDAPRPGVNPSHRYKHALFNKEYQERTLSQCIQEQCHIDSGPSINNQGKSEEPKTPPPSPQNEKEDANVTEQTEAPVKINAKPKTNTDKPKTNTSSTNRRPKKPGQGAKAPGKNAPARPQSSQGAPATAKAVSLRPPFVMFGSRDRELQMGVKKTHNVKAPCYVHASAVRAQKWRKEQREKRLKSAPAASDKRHRRPLSFDDIMDRETSAWTTEYGGHFRTYTPAEYERNAASRMSVRRCTDIDVATTRDGVRIASGMGLVTGKT